MSNVICMNLLEYGKSLGPREIAAKLRAEALACINRGDRIKFGFKDIEIISSGFADELFGKLFLEIGENEFHNKIKFNGFSTEQNKDVIMSIIKKSITFRRQEMSSELREQ